MVERVEMAVTDVKGSQPGNDVFGSIHAHGGGAFVLYFAILENVLVLKPTNLTLEDEASVPVVAVTAL